MRLFRKLKAAVSAVSAGALTALSVTPAFADGFERANTVMEKVSTGLHGLAAITITVAVIWVGLQDALER
ncbi:TrbC/VirB2 family protein [Martelella alba]|uniref:TrbC/VirB2 family protein n=1 Tax=Martelella alba TaxID=2590451 RepID=UPI001E376CAF|nr:TrbC/VirB2 family protein [Martelella alba]